MLREDGIVMDDGTTTRISENHYHMTTTTAQAANVLSHLEYYLQLVWPELNGLNSWKHIIICSILYEIGEQRDNPVRGSDPLRLYSKL